MPATSCPSKSQVNKAGRTIRKFFSSDFDLILSLDTEKVDKAMETLIEYRAAHQYPLAKANMGLRSMVSTEGCQIEVSQRLKRTITIINKLAREPTMQLANMQDVGGCRAVLGSIDEVRRVEKRLRKNRPVVRVSDYITDPRASGYRGIHVIVEYDDRMIEIQLRTRVMLPKSSGPTISPRSSIAMASEMASIRDNTGCGPLLGRARGHR